MRKLNTKTDKQGSVVLACDLGHTRMINHVKETADEQLLMVICATCWTVQYTTMSRW